MRPAALGHIAAALVGGSFAGIVVLGTLSFLNRDVGFASCTAMADYVWVTLLLAGLIIGGVILLLLDFPEADECVSDSTVVTSTCASCGGSIIEDCRLCPHCGEMFDKERSLYE